MAMTRDIETGVEVMRCCVEVESGNIGVAAGPGNPLPLLIAHCGGGGVMTPTPDDAAPAFPPSGPAFRLEIRPGRPADR
jgi:hypothetical protein